MKKSESVKTTTDSGDFRFESSSIEYRRANKQYAPMSVDEVREFLESLSASENAQRMMNGLGTSAARDIHTLFVCRYS